MIEMLMNAELSVLEFINSLHNPLTDRMFVFITHLGDKGLLWIIIGIFMCFFKNTRRSGIVMLIALLMMLVIGNLTLKPLVARIRPYEHLEGIKLLIEKPTDFSFPSGHTFSSFAAAISALLYNKKLGMMFVVIAFLIAISRLYLCVHFPSDVLCGAVMGGGTAYLAKYITEKFEFLKNV